MKKNITLAVIIGIVSIIIIIGLAVSTTPVNNQPQTSVPVQPEPEGKSFTLKLDDSVSTSTP